MKEPAIALKINDLFKLEQDLYMLLENEQYEQFQALEITFSKQLKDLVKGHSPESLSREQSRLKQLENNLSLLKAKSEECLEQLKRKNLLQKRNKNRAKAYK